MGGHLRPAVLHREFLEALGLMLRGRDEAPRLYRGWQMPGLWYAHHIAMQFSHWNPAGVPDEARKNLRVMDLSRRMVLR